MTPNPYENLGQRSFWRKAVAELRPTEGSELYIPKWEHNRDWKVVR